MNLMACMGLVWILKDSYILDKPRKYLKSKAKWLDKLLSCSMCLGFWVGVLLSLFQFFILKDSSNIYYYPLASSAFCFFVDVLMDVMQETWVKLKTEREKNE